MLAETVAQNLLSNTDSSQRNTYRASEHHPNKSIKVLVLVARETQQTFNINASKNSEIIIGRTDRLTNYMPTLNLATMGGYRLGVSRLHAELIFEGNSVNIVDLNSINGTSINNMDLVANEPYTLNVGDELQLGSFILDVVAV